MSEHFLSTDQLAARWGVDSGTLINWRSKRRGPRYTKLGTGKQCRVIYPLSWVLRYEKRMLVKTNYESGPAAG